VGGGGEQVLRCIQEIRPQDIVVGQYTASKGHRGYLEHPSVSDVRSPIQHLISPRVKVMHRLLLSIVELRLGFCREKACREERVRRCRCAGLAHAHVLHDGA